SSPDFTPCSMRCSWFAWRWSMRGVDLVSVDWAKTVADSAAANTPARTNFTFMCVSPWDWGTGGGSDLAYNAPISRSCTRPQVTNCKTSSESDVSIADASYSHRTSGVTRATSNRSILESKHEDLFRDGRPHRRKHRCRPDLDHAGAATCQG